MKTPRPSSSPTDARNARLASALKANMARRKAQARARGAVEEDQPDEAVSNPHGPEQQEA